MILDDCGTEVRIRFPPAARRLRTNSRQQKTSSRLSARQQVAVTKPTMLIALISGWIQSAGWV
jgi:hypothetical protein